MRRILFLLLLIPLAVGCVQVVRPIVSGEGARLTFYDTLVVPLKWNLTCEANTVVVNCGSGEGAELPASQDSYVCRYASGETYTINITPYLDGNALPETNFTVSVYPDINSYVLSDANGYAPGSVTLSWYVGDLLFSAQLIDCGEGNVVELNAEVRSYGCFYTRPGVYYPLLYATEDNTILAVTSAEVNVLPDTNPPEVNLYYDGNVVCSAVDGETRVSSVEVNVEGNVTVCEGNTCTVDVSGLPSGTHHAVCRAFDAAGNVGTAELNFLIDRPPEITVYYPPNGMDVNAGQSIPVIWRAEDDLSTPEVQVVCDNDPRAGLPAEGFLRCRVFWSNVVTVRAVDSGGNVAEVNVELNLLEGEPSPLPPVVLIITPAQGTEYNAPAEVNVEFVAVDPEEGVTDINVVCGEENVEVNAVDGFQGVTCEFNRPGERRIEVWARGSSGLISSSAVTVVLRDVTPPAILIKWPPPGKVYRAPADVPVSWEASDDSGEVVITVDCGNGTVLEDLPTDGSVTCEYGAPGVYTIRLVATDPSGNSSESTTWVKVRRRRRAVPPPPPAPIEVEKTFLEVGEVSVTEGWARKAVIEVEVNSSSGLEARLVDEENREVGECEVRDRRVVCEVREEGVRRVFLLLRNEDGEEKRIEVGSVMVDRSLPEVEVEVNVEGNAARGRVRVEDISPVRVFVDCDGDGIFEREVGEEFVCRYAEPSERKIVVKAVDAAGNVNLKGVVVALKGTEKTEEEKEVEERYVERSVPTGYAPLAAGEVDVGMTLTIAGLVFLLVVFALRAFMR